MAPGQQSPYSAISAMAIDPIFISVPQVPEFAALGGEAALSPADRDALDGASAASPRIEHRDVRAAEAARAARGVRALSRARVAPRQRARRARSRPTSASRPGGSRTTRLFRALHAREQRAAVDGVAGGAAASRAAARSIAPAASSPTKCCSSSICSGSPASQWRQARAAARHGVALFGDLPFMVDGDSADVWVRQHQFRLDMSVGAPPDAFSATGQDWGMPVYQWDALAAEDYRWLRERARRSADLFDGYRVDHLVGFYRTYGRLKRRRRGILHAVRRTGAARAGRTRARRCFAAPAPRSSPRISAPCPTSCARRSRGSACPGSACSAGSGTGTPTGSRSAIRRTTRRVSVAASGTHDTEPVALWWDAASPSRARGRSASCRRSSGSTGGADLIDRRRSMPTVRDVLLEVLFASGVRPAVAAGAGRVRLARSHQRAGDRQRRELDLSSAVAGRSAGRRSPRRASGKNSCAPGRSVTDACSAPSAEKNCTRQEKTAEDAKHAGSAQRKFDSPFSSVAERQQPRSTVMNKPRRTPSTRSSRRANFICSVSPPERGSQRPARPETCQHNPEKPPSTLSTRSRHAEHTDWMLLGFSSSRRFGTASASHETRQP